MANAGQGLPPRPEPPRDKKPGSRGIVIGIAGAIVIAGIAAGVVLPRVGGDKPVVAYCSMEKKSWLQPKGAITNPYVDAAMRACGEVKTQ